MKLSERMKEVFATSQDLTVWVGHWIDEVAQLEADLKKSVQANITGLAINESLQAENERFRRTINKHRLGILAIDDDEEIDLEAREVNDEGTCDGG